MMFARPSALIRDTETAPTLRRLQRKFVAAVAIVLSRWEAGVLYLIGEHIHVQLILAQLTA